MKEKEVLIAMAALSQANRLRLFRLLVVAGPHGATPGSLGRKLKVSPATLSFHLKELANARLVSQQRDGRNLIYRANFAAMNALLAYMTENCCGTPATPAPAFEC